MWLAHKRRCMAHGEIMTQGDESAQEDVVSHWLQMSRVDIQLIIK